ncbi:MAG: HAMP domain-containing sensor histidine kinase [Nocardioides sp.]|uniref:HAMP domain-containing sensor histidine kinase n=1 Tax=Nocardioides sp. TaxID=35761 RepID=UPI0039E3C3D6
MRRSLDVRVSLRARILALGVGAAVAVLVLLTVPVAVSTYRTSEQETEQRASTLVQGVADYISTGSAAQADLTAVVTRLNDRDNEAPVAVLLPDGSRIGSSATPCASVASASRGGLGRDGRHDDDHGRRGGDLLPTSQVTTSRTEGGRVVRIGTSEAGREVTVCAYVPDSVVRSATATQLGALGAAGLLIVSLVALAALLIARRLARDLTAMARTADRLGEGDLDARVPDSGPAEVRRVGAALNRLAGRIDELLALERETVADLSHRLRTPMTAVRLDVEALPESVAKAELEDHFAQLERTLTAVIQAARRPQREGALPSADLVKVVRDRFEFWQPLLDDQGRNASLCIELPDDLRVRAAEGDLAAALDALLENAIAHTPIGTSVRVEAALAALAGHADATRAQVDVLDRGDGVPAIALQRGLSDRGSTGLGLDIARSCAEASGGAIELGERPAGDAHDGTWRYVRLVLGAR